ncbi:MAG TPA: hypothetical protein VMU15_20965 [Anaeromyxobacter sp.]|nr:hypothetical protein [Anaeromyxobacter sp.]
MTTRTLYRPVGLKELELVLAGEGRAFPPRLPEQPIFYPVLNRDYATQIARDWNPPDRASGFSGFVTEFDVDAEYLTRFETKTVGASLHQELWVPAAELPTFSDHIRSRIRVSSAFYGPAYEGPVPLPLLVRARNPRAQLKVLREALNYNGMDFGMEVSANWKLVLLNFGFWSATASEEQDLAPADAARTLAAIRTIWEPHHSDLPLPAGTLVSPKG